MGWRSNSETRGMQREHADRDVRNEENLFWGEVVGVWVYASHGSGSRDRSSIT